MKIRNVSKTKLFSEGSLSDYLSARMEKAKREIAEEIENMMDREILETSEKEITDKLYKNIA